MNRLHVLDTTIPYRLRLVLIKWLASERVVEHVFMIVTNKRPLLFDLLVHRLIELLPLEAFIVSQLMQRAHFIFPILRTTVDLGLIVY